MLSRSVLSDSASLWPEPTRPFCPWDFPGKNRHPRAPGCPGPAGGFRWSQIQTCAQRVCDQVSHPLVKWNSYFKAGQEKSRLRSSLCPRCAVCASLGHQPELLNGGRARSAAPAFVFVLTLPAQIRKGMAFFPSFEGGDGDALCRVYWSAYL